MVRFSLCSKGNPKRIHNFDNQFYIDDARILKNATANDYKIGLYGHRRSYDNLRWARVIIMTCTNEFSEDPAAWQTPADVEAVFSDVDYWIVYDRYHMKPYHERTARPRFNVLFPVDVRENYQNYGKVRPYGECVKLAMTAFPYFDEESKKPLRAFNGGYDGPEELIRHDGNITLKEFRLPEERQPRMDPARQKDLAAEFFRAADQLPCFLQLHLAGSNMTVFIRTDEIRLISGSRKLPGSTMYTTIHGMETLAIREGIAEIRQLLADQM